MQDLFERVFQEEGAAEAEWFSLAESSKQWAKILKERNKDPDGAG
jgi:hypothetical protein